MSKPVLSLRKGDEFVAEDDQFWVVDEVTPPTDHNSLPQVGERPKVFTVLAHRGQKNRRLW